jgi:hypothetical protein
VSSTASVASKSPAIDGLVEAKAKTRKEDSTNNVDLIVISIDEIFLFFNLMQKLNGEKLGFMELELECSTIKNDFPQYFFILLFNFKTIICLLCSWGMTF